MKFISVILIIIFFYGCSSNNKVIEVNNKSLSAYEIELNKVNNKSNDVDFYKLRMSYTDTVEYSPYTADRSNTKKAFKLLRNKDFKKCLEVASQILTQEYVNIDGHFLSMMCNNKLGYSKKGEFHKYVFNGLVDSIKNNGDGKTKDTAYTTISTDELYTFLNIYGLRTNNQSLERKNNKAYDVMTVINKKKKEFIVYFDITKQMSQINKLFN